jgi:beta-phosphoglucomutase
LKKIEGCIFHLDYILNYSKNSTGLRDIKRFLINLRMSGMKLGVASKNTTIVDVLKVLQLEDFFDVILDNGDLNLNFKPLLLRTAERLKISPENCVVFDNETDGLNDAKMLNMSAIGIGNNIPTSIADKMVPTNFSNVNSSILNFN